MFQIFARRDLYTAVTSLTGIHINLAPRKRHYKVTVVGAAGATGQALSLLLKINSLVSHLALHDISSSTHDIAADISIINTPVHVTGHKGNSELADAVTSADVVLIPANVRRGPYDSPQDQFRSNANLIRDITISMARNCPEAIVAIITNPLNSLVPIASEVLKNEGVYDPRRVMGVTALDVVRACTFVGEVNEVNPSHVSIPVIGGNCGNTIVPVLSESTPSVGWCPKIEIDAITEKIQEAENEVVKAKGGQGTATLSMAFAAAKFTTSILRALSGEDNIVECAYVLTGLSKPSYFSLPVLLGQCGVEQIMGAGPLNPFEAELLKKAMPELLADIRSGVTYISAYHC